MMEETPGPKARKPRSRPAGKAAAETAVAKVKSTIHLTVEASQRLDIHCAMLGFDRSTLVEKLINDNLREFVVQRRGARSFGLVADDEAAA
jgi:hypothetical protein